MMRHENIAIPESIEVSPEGVMCLETLRNNHGETRENYVLGSIGLAAAWGQMIVNCSFSSNFQHGLIDVKNNTIRLYDIPGLIDRQIIEDETSNLAIDRMGIERFESSESGIDFDIPTEFAENLKNVCLYYDRDFIDIVKLALVVRDDVLNTLSPDCLYTFSADGTLWDTAWFGPIT